MKFKILQVGPYGVNCTALRANGRVILVDPGAEASRLAAQLAADGLVPTAILLTHAHFDHIGGIPGLLARFPNLPVFLHPADIPVFSHPFNQMPPDYPHIDPPPTLLPLDARQTTPLFAANEEFGDLQVIETPGHTPGGVCYYFPSDKLLLSGDTLFAGSVGRTDFPGGDMASLRASLEKIAALPDDTRVIPGHGPLTTIAVERRSNPFLR